MGASFLVRDTEVMEKLVTTAIQILYDRKHLSSMQSKLAEVARPNATEAIVSEIKSLIES
jgi:UDP-N-acetylglucosamine:LPS N-acetylglucosamine transferase